MENFDSGRLKLHQSQPTLKLEHMTKLDLVDVLFFGGEWANQLFGRYRKPKGHYKVHDRI